MTAPQLWNVDPTPPVRGIEVTFLHVPRVGGTSLVRSLNEADVIVAAGHDLRTREGLVVTILREPRSRLLSEYLFLRSRPEQTYRDVSMSLFEYIGMRGPVYDYVSECDLVGIHERYPKMLAALSERLGKPLVEFRENPLYIPEGINVGASAQRLRAALDAVCAKDLIVYGQHAYGIYPDEILGFAWEKYGIEQMCS